MQYAITLDGMKVLRGQLWEKVEFALAFAQDALPKINCYLPTQV